MAYLLRRVLAYYIDVGIILLIWIVFWKLPFHAAPLLSGGRAESGFSGVIIPFFNLVTCDAFELFTDIIAFVIRLFHDSPQMLLGNIGRLLWEIVVDIVVGPLVEILTAFLTIVLYRSLMECSVKQATYGKIVLGIKVTDLHGNRISFGRALLRNGILTILPYLSVISLPFTAKKQGLHDLIAGTLVVIDQ